MEEYTLDGRLLTLLAQPLRIEEELGDVAQYLGMDAFFNLK